MDKFTIKDIAKLSDVSTATVSNYLNGNYAKMSTQTKTKLAEIIDKTNYKPNTIARNLAKNENRTIGVSVADITNPFTSPIISGISASCNTYGYELIFTDSNNDELREVANINQLRNNDVAGLIIDPVNPNNEVYNQLSNSSSVLVDRKARRSTLDTVITDNTESVETMTAKMLANGYDEVYFVTWPLSDISTRLDRYIGFSRATGYLDDQHLLTLPYDYQLDSTDELCVTIKNIISQTDKKIGFFTMNSSVLQNFLNITKALSFSYPQDFGVATYEDFDWMTLINPAISCIRQDSFAIGVTAVEMLHDKLSTKETVEPVPTIKTISTDIIIRDSF